MRPIFRTHILAILIFLTGTLAAMAEIAGEYFVYGRNPDGSAYEGTLQILGNPDGSYTVNWQVGSSYSGRGELKGDVFTVDWGDIDPAVYVVMPDGELHGTWGDGVGLELLTQTQR
jgi:hypothetical protein